ncbi:MAG TPA: S-layer homology domain-containing protein [Candidatus Gordonibacter avicola]|nr:S-layer homology domain-containing protein [Candidatus Gordonibacter avicola]
MTACVNNEGLSGKKVVSATLAGVLAAGMVPAIAFADEAAEASTDEGIDLLINDKGAFEGGSLASATDNASSPNPILDLTNIQFEYDGSAHYVKPVTVALAEGAGVPINVSNTSNWEHKYYKAKADGTIDDSAEITDPGNATSGVIEVGTYYLRIKGLAGAAPYTDAVLDVKFSIVGSSLSNAYMYEGTDKTDHDYSFTGKDLGLKFAIGSTDLAVNTDYKVNFYKDASSSPSSTVMYAGKYTAVLEGQGKYAGQKLEIPFEVKAVDLATAAIETEIDPSAGPKVTKINTIGDLKDFVDLEFVSAKDGSKYFGNNTSYTYKVKFTTNDAKKEAASSVIGTQDIIIDKVAKPATINYGATPAALSGQTLKVHLADPDGDRFDPSLIEVKYTDAAGKEKKATQSEYDIIVKDKDGNDGTLDSLKTPGTWLVTVKVNAEALKYAAGGSATMTVVVDNEEINPDSNLFVKVDGETIVGDSTSTDFTGSDILKKVAIILKDKSGNVLTEGEDYDVTITNEDGEEVNEIINAGTYTFKVTSTVYTIQGGDATFELTVDPVTLAAANVRIDKNSQVTTNGTDYFYAYTGEAITPTYQYTLSASPTTAPEDEWMTLPADAYVAKYALNGSSVKEIVKVGAYSANLYANKDNGNFNITGALALADNIVVSDEKIFEDVPSDAWFAKVVYQAEKNDYMNGYYGTKLFGANNNITRADVVCVLYNMAGGELGTTDDDKGYTSFNDVDSKMYYAKAVAWAKKAGIANGFGDGTFGPEQNISRQDFACMLANFAKVKGDFTKPSDIDAILGGFDDGAQVADYAKESVAWAAEQKIMGNGGLIMPTSTITRAEVAAMTVNYQPEKIVK